MQRAALCVLADRPVSELWEACGWGRWLINAETCSRKCSNSTITSLASRVMTMNFRARSPSRGRIKPCSTSCNYSWAASRAKQKWRGNELSWGFPVTWLYIFLYGKCFWTWKICQGCMSDTISCFLLVFVLRYFKSVWILFSTVLFLAQPGKLGN